MSDHKVEDGKAIFGDDDDKENHGGEMIPASKKTRYNGSNNPLIEQENNNILMFRQNWVPNHIMSFWENEALRKMVTVIVVLDGGVSLKNDVKVKVSDDGNFLTVKQKLSSLVTNVDELHSYFRKKDTTAYPAYHPKIVGFHKYMRAIKEGQGEEITNLAHIVLPFQVQTDVVAMHKFSNKQGVRLVYVDLRAVQTDDYVEAEEPDEIKLD
jgi:hypothetical protein